MKNGYGKKEWSKLGVKNGKMMKNNIRLACWALMRVLTISLFICFIPQEQTSPNPGRTCSKGKNWIRHNYQLKNWILINRNYPLIASLPLWSSRILLGLSTQVPLPLVPGAGNTCVHGRVRENTEGWCASALGQEPSRWPVSDSLRSVQVTVGAPFHQVPVVLLHACIFKSKPLGGCVGWGSRWSPLLTDVNWRVRVEGQKGTIPGLKAAKKKISFFHSFSQEDFSKKSFRFSKIIQELSWV